ncbi:MAG: SpoIIE family protein phosphatase [Bacteroidales bacterium]|nr:SpoIIE family protein phosphatase [Bacteroidales bacterium]
MIKKLMPALLALIITFSGLAAVAENSPRNILDCIRSTYSCPDSSLLHIARYQRGLAGASGQEIRDLMRSLTRMADSTADERLMCASRMFAGVCFINNQMYSDALPMVSAASKYSHDSNQRNYLDFLLALCYKGTGRHDLSAPCLENIMSYGVDSGRPFLTLLYCESLRIMSDYYQSVGNSRLALRFIDEYCKLSDTISCGRLPMCFLVFPQNIQSKYIDRHTVVIVSDPVAEACPQQRNTSSLPFLWPIAGLAGIAGISLRYIRKRRKAVPIEAPQCGAVDGSDSLDQVPVASLLGNTQNAVSIVESNGLISWVNPGFEKLYGSTRNEFILTYGDNAFLITKIEGRGSAFEKCMTIKESQSMVSKVRTGFNTEIWVKTTITPVLDNGKISRYVVEDVDVSTLKNETKAVGMINNQLTASLRNASEIQRLLMPNLDNMRLDLRHFVIFRPKEYVSGDFFWYNKVDNVSYLAVGDCTGHGPSASLLCVLSTKTLDEIALIRHILDPKQMLDLLDESIIKSLRKRDAANCDGLDITICRIERTDSGARITVAGAQSYFIYHSGGETTLLKGAKRSIGGIIDFQMKHSFENREVVLNNGDRFFLTSDGAIDQNNPNRRSLGSRRFCDILHNSCHMPLDMQQTFVESHIEEWAAGEPQRDDICIVGVEI